VRRALERSDCWGTSFDTSRRRVEAPVRAHSHRSDADINPYTPTESCLLSWQQWAEKAANSDDKQRSCHAVSKVDAHTCRYIFACCGCSSGSKHVPRRFL
jgi:hypothetical protein